MARFNLRQRIGLRLLGGKHKDFIPALPSDTGSLGSTGTIKEYRSKSEQLSANVGWCFTANNAIVEPLSAIPIKLYRSNKKGEKEEVKQHPILELLDAPNLALTGEQLRQLHGTYMNFTGESYILMLDADGPFEPGKGKLPGALDILPAHKVSFRLGDVYTRSTVTYAGKTYPISAFVRDINPDPDNHYTGRSIIKASALSIDLEDQMKRWSQKTFVNGAQPDLVVSVPDGMDDEVFERFQQQLNDNMVGTENAHRPLIIEGATNVQPFMLSARDLDFLKSRQFSKDEILAMWRVSPEIIGYTVNSNRSTMDAAFTLHAIINLVPRMRQFVRQLNATLVKPYNDTLELGFESPVPEDIEKKLKYAESATGRFLTIDEVRAMFGQGELPNSLGQQIYMAGSNRPLSYVATPPIPASPPPPAPASTEGGDAQAGAKKAA